MRACSTVGGQSRVWVAPHAETAVRSASMGLAWRGTARSTVITVSGTGAVGSRYARIPVAGPEQVRDDRVRAVLDEIADPVAAVEQSPALAVDLAERGLAGEDALEAG